MPVLGWVAWAAAVGGGELDGVMETLMLYWQGVMVIFLAMFVLSCVGALAQHTQLMLDQEESNKLRAQLSDDVRLSCTYSVILFSSFFLTVCDDVSLLIY